MIEIIYNEPENNDGTVLIKPPKNIRQIGSPKGRHKIYIEDYVYTFLHSAVFGKADQRRAAVLLGKSEVSQEIRYTFISGAIGCEEFIFQNNEILFDEKCWEYIYEEIKQHFGQLEIAGWFLEAGETSSEPDRNAENAHRKYFAGCDKILFLSEPTEGEDAFFTQEQGKLQKKEGYYIYYEKNTAMQEYMVSVRDRLRETEFSMDSLKNENTEEERTEESEGSEEKTAAEQAIRNYRAMFQEKKGAPTQRRMNLLLYTAAAAAMVVLCVIGVTTMNNYEKMRQVEQTLSVMAGLGQESRTEENEKKPETSKEEVSVESVPGEVTPEPSQTPESETQQTEPTESETGQTGPEESGTQQSEPLESELQESEQPKTQEQETEAFARTYLEQGYYIVQPGDKLELICKNIYQTTAIMDKLCEVNGIEDVDKIYAGQKLILP